MKKKSVCLVVVGLYLANGKASQCRLLAEKLYRSGVPVRIINISPFLKPGSSSLPECWLEKNLISSLPEKIEVTEIVSHDQLLKQLWLTRKKYEIVCFAGNHFLGLPKYFVFLKIIGKKVVVLFSSRYQPEGGIHWYQKHWLPVDKLIAVSKALEDDLLKSSGTGAFSRKVVTILNRIDSQALRELTVTDKKDLKKRLGLKQTEKIVIFVGGIGHAKGIDLLLDAWGIIRERVPEARLLLVGPLCSLCSHNSDYLMITRDGKNRLAKKMEIFAKFAGLAGQHEKISYLGVKPNVSDYLAVSEIMIFPSRTEVSPNAPMEAMAAGLPVVAFDNKEIMGEIVRHQQEGLLVPDEDFVALAEAAVSLLQDGRQRERLGFNARKRFKDRLIFDDRQTERFLEAFNRT